MKNHGDQESSMRRIRSFVLRTGRITAGQKRAMEEVWPRFGLDTDTTTIDFTAEFGNAAPVTLEIGFGNGDNLVDMAANAPNDNFIGIEVHDPGVGSCLLGVEKQQLENVRVI
jgi:tRNA (guanine-N7-)-methyltransferase